MDKATLLSQLEDSRTKYKPEVIKTVIIAEAPPDSVERFFYYEDVKKADFLFLGIVEVLYPEAKKKYLEYNRHTQIKEIILKQLQIDGYFLLDLFELPISLCSDNEIQAVSKLTKKLEKICDSKTPIILIKANVFDIAYKPLKLKFNVMNKRIEFPSCGNQLKFQTKFTELIKQFERQIG
jgi:hypothetical protein